MHLGHLYIHNGAVITHRDSFMLDSISVVSVRRPYLGGAWLLSLSLFGFGIAFFDLLYGSEVFVLTAIGCALLLVGSYIGQLSLLSRDLKGTELSSAIWGTPWSLDLMRRKIVKARQEALAGEDHEK